ncbi:MULTISPECIES: hypothetical protein [unclassified Psychrobacter]|uniref:hypothetical protein n=1 Tax=unclassified Psychrobacter TaxID=196806 RepID=UPI000ECE7476|nr:MULTISPECIES: hypothetical protein [unclassified Psychrobacter]MBE8608604.1 hypothetical protein [Pseudomonas lundensis]HCI75226.1 hypothetical protein [Psychrobacter sp.]
MNIQPEKPLSVSLQTQTLDARVLSTFDVMIVHYSQTELIGEINSTFPDAIHSLQQELLSYHMIDSPVIVTLSPDISNILEVHLQECELLSRNHGLLTLIDYTPAEIRANKTRISAQEYLPNEPEWQQSPATTNDLNLFKLDTKQVAHTLSLNQIIYKGGKKKHLRYLDAQVLIHLLPLNQHNYIANRYGYPKRLWLSLSDNWHSVDNIHHYIPDHTNYIQHQSSYCPLTQNQLDDIGMLNRFFVKKGVGGCDLILNQYETLISWLDKANTQLTAATHLTNPVDRMTMMNRWLYECYEQSGLVEIDN